ncbi:unnamed protein product [Darwinula stevensoni]|uniref:Uncharacterized protein n=1 Tax=Darwinula stevensoni TaxID=69355 RepID=A0A7R8XDD6_9CRUS|nr:unnamed protein product [Darwinula stevensoni]CAG0894205.1 unnamed protein product [Darwinula stevensoni]
MKLLALAVVSLAVVALAEHEDLPGGEKEDGSREKRSPEPSRAYEGTNIGYHRYRYPMHRSRRYGIPPWLANSREDSSSEEGDSREWDDEKRKRMALRKKRMYMVPPPWGNPWMYRKKRMFHGFDEEGSSEEEDWRRRRPEGGGFMYRRKKSHPLTSAELEELLENGDLRKRKRSELWRAEPWFHPRRRPFPYDDDKKKKRSWGPRRGSPEEEEESEEDERGPQHPAPHSTWEWSDYFGYDRRKREAPPAHKGFDRWNKDRYRTTMEDVVFGPRDEQEKKKPGSDGAMKKPPHGEEEDDRKKRNKKKRFVVKKRQGMDSVEEDCPAVLELVSDCQEVAEEAGDYRHLLVDACNRHEICSACGPYLGLASEAQCDAGYAEDVTVLCEGDRECEAIARVAAKIMDDDDDDSDEGGASEADVCFEPCIVDFFERKRK